MPLLFLSFYRWTCIWESQLNRTPPSGQARVYLYRFTWLERFHCNENAGTGRRWTVPKSTQHASQLMLVPKSYAKIHREIVSGQAPQRYVTWRCDPKYSKYQKETEWCGGLRDRTFGIINAFLYALLNDRAFIMDSKVLKLYRISLPYWSIGLSQFPVPWEDLFDSPNGVEWQYTTERKAHLKTLNTTEVYYQIDDALIPFNKHEEIKDFQNIIMQGDRFVSWSWIRDSPQAKAMGLPAEGGFACMIDCEFLFFAMDRLYLRLHLNIAGRFIHSLPGIRS